MKYYIGIDLGTTNSTICSYDGENVRIWKSPEQNDVTPSAILLGPRGKTYVGRTAYDNAPRTPGSAATLFKRFMGTNTPIHFSDFGITKTPEECSAEVLRTLFGYLPEDIRTGGDIGTVITVPAAFNQMQKDATMQAAEMAGIGKVALMQEPVAAVMSVMRLRKNNGKFLIYDIGGGTFDIALAESTNARVNLLAHGGIAMCGGRDMDRALWENIVRPWLMENFDLPVDLSVVPEYKALVQLAIWATEKAKIDLSREKESVVYLPETEVRMRDIRGKEIYLETPLSRDDFNRLIGDQINSTVLETRNLLLKSGVNSTDIDCIVFVGGPTNYKPLRDIIASELALPANIDINPMTAVAEGASIYAESVDWSSLKHGRKNARGQIRSGGALSLSFNYTARTPDVKAKIAVQLASSLSAGWEFQIDCLDTGWTSGRMALKHGLIIDVTLGKRGRNSFRATVFDPQGALVPLENDAIIIDRTFGTVDSIPASHSVGLEVLDKLGGVSNLHFLVRAGDVLPKKGTVSLKAGETLKAGSPDSLNFKLWEGDITDRISQNRPIGSLKISGSDFDEGVISTGADLRFEYEILDSGQIIVGVSVDTVRAFKKENLYFRQGNDGPIYGDPDSSRLIIEKGELALSEIDDVAEHVDDPRIEQARTKLEHATSLDPEEQDPEKAMEADERILEAKKIMASVRKDHQRFFRQKDLDESVELFERYSKEIARPSEVTRFNNLTKTAQGMIDADNRNFDPTLKELNGIIYGILWRQPWFHIEQFKSLVASPQLFTDKKQFEELCKLGAQYLRSDDIDNLKQVIRSLYGIMRKSANVEDMYDIANVLLG